ncbi:Melanoma-associated antigen 11 [Heterocephalus glaber]|uniref:Melanoma-associated antigen 11 n=2 Tax=Heterocephalus glaber TaxID=10181 RepID=G5BTX1_HETGA|nr:Melanoma-associated antigen 11 [Heterocephalus glaber]
MNETSEGGQCPSSLRPHGPVTAVSPGKILTMSLGAYGAQGLEGSFPDFPPGHQRSLDSGPLEEEEVPTVMMLSTPQSLPQSSPGVCSSALQSKLDEESRSQGDEDTSGSLVKNALDKKVAELVQFMLLRYQTKELITKADMLNIVIQEYEEQFPVIFRKAHDFTELVFGIVVTELDPNTHTYISYNMLDHSYQGMLTENQAAPKTSLLIFVLGMIFMKGNCVPEDKMWEVLNALEVYAEREHFIYGDPRELITNDWVQKRYLVYQQVPNSDPKSYEFRWGPRAHAEIREGKLLEFLAKLKGIILNSFPAWCKDALKNIGDPRL